MNKKTNETCAKCGGQGSSSKAMLNSMVSFNDFGNDAGRRGTTQSRGCDAYLVDCLKCEKCGHSWVPDYMNWWNSLNNGKSTNHYELTKKHLPEMVNHYHSLTPNQISAIFFKEHAKITVRVIAKEDVTLMKYSTSLVKMDVPKGTEIIGEFVSEYIHKLPIFIEACGEKSTIIRLHDGYMVNIDHRKFDYLIVPQPKFPALVELKNKLKGEEGHKLAFLKDHFEKEKATGFVGFINTHLFVDFDSYMEHAWNNDYDFAYKIITEVKNSIQQSSAAKSPRQIAIKWFNDLKADQNFVDGLKGLRRAYNITQRYYPERQMSSLTGREIEMMWDKEKEQALKKRIVKSNQKQFMQADADKVSGYLAKFSQRDLLEVFLPVIFGKLDDENKVKMFGNVYQMTPDHLKWDGVNNAAPFFTNIAQAYNAGRQNHSNLVANKHKAKQWWDDLTEDRKQGVYIKYYDVYPTDEIKAAVGMVTQDEIINMWAYSSDENVNSSEYYTKTFGRFE